MQSKINLQTREKNALSELGEKIFLDRYAVKDVKRETLAVGDTVVVLVLNASLKHGPDLSNTEEVANMIIKHMKEHGEVESETIRLSDKNIPVGLKLKESEDDEWPTIADKMKKADIILFATPIWWGQRSSLMQRIIERMDAFDEGEAGGREALLNKVAGVVVTGSSFRG